MKLLAGSVMSLSLLALVLAMTHMAVQDAVDGKVVDWMEKVSDEQYRAKPDGR